jgi:hypothetical protein
MLRDFCRKIGLTIEAQDYELFIDYNFLKTDVLKNENLPFKAENIVGALQKQQLLEECKVYIKKTSPDNEAPTEIQSVILNSEQDFRYNASKQLIIIANFSDVLAINKQSRGNIRSFKFWDYTL